jgi:hypothetical protein
MSPNPGAENMTNAEMADLRGELFGVKILLISCLTQVAGTAPDPLAHLEAAGRAALEGIMKAAPSNIRPQYLRAFQNAAAGIVSQAIEAAKVPHEPTPPRDRLQ